MRYTWTNRKNLCVSFITVTSVYGCNSFRKMLKPTFFSFKGFISCDFRGLGGLSAWVLCLSAYHHRFAGIPIVFTSSIVWEMWQDFDGLLLTYHSTRTTHIQAAFFSFKLSMCVIHFFVFLQTLARILNVSLNSKRTTLFTKSNIPFCTRTLNIDIDSDQEMMNERPIVWEHYFERTSYMLQIKWHVFWSSPSFTSFPSSSPHSSSQLSKKIKKFVNKLVCRLTDCFLTYPSVASVCLSVCRSELWEKCQKQWLKWKIIIIPGGKE